MSIAETLRQDAASFERAARIAGAAYLLTDATAIFSEFFVRSRLIIGGDSARTAGNIVAHARLFRGSIVADLITGAGVVILNLALYELLASVNRRLARFAAFWRLVEVAVGSAITVSSFVVLSLLSGADYAGAFELGQLRALTGLYLGAQASGYMIVLLFFALGSTTYMYLLLRSRYVPMALALLGLGGSALVGLFALARMLYPATVAGAFAAVRALPAAVLVLLVPIAAPILAFEIILGLWLLVKGVRIRASTP